MKPNLVDKKLLRSLNNKSQLSPLPPPSNTSKSFSSYYNNNKSKIKYGIIITIIACIVLGLYSRYRWYKSIKAAKQTVEKELIEEVVAPPQPAPPITPVEELPVSNNRKYGKYHFTINDTTGTINPQPMGVMARDAPLTPYVPIMDDYGEFIYSDDYY